METTLKNPGLLHLAENIFLNLETEDLEVCEKINQSSKQILEDPSFWLWKLMLKGLPEEKNLNHDANNKKRFISKKFLLSS